MQQQLVHHLAGPYRITGRHGESYYLDDIRDLMSDAPHFVRNYLQLADRGESSIPFGLGMGIHTLWSHGSFGLCDDLSGMAGVLYDNLATVANGLLEQGQDLEGLDGYFEIRHVHSHYLFSGMDPRVFLSLVHNLSNWGKASVSERLRRWRRYEAQPQHQQGAKRSRVRLYRKIATTQERRITAGHVIEYGDAIVRGQRRHLPSAWEDIFRGDVERCWKRKKIRKQWMKHL